MKQTLQLHTGQHLTLTPQLQQAIHLLQLPTLEVLREIERLLENNPMLDREEELGIEAAKTESTEINGLNGHDNESLLSVTTKWDDAKMTGTATASYSSHDFSPENNQKNPEDLRDYLCWQVNISHLSEKDREIAEVIIDAISDSGFLTSNVDEICSTVNKIDHENIEPEEVEAVLHYIQQFEPFGVGARDLQESLLIQLDHLPKKTLWRKEAIDIVKNHFPLLAQHDLPKLTRLYHFHRNEIIEIVHLIQSLSPRPGSQIFSESNDYVIPDVIVTKIDHQWCVELNTEALPRLRINPNYTALIRRADQSDDNQFLRNYLQEARWFLKSLESRNETLLKVATAIVQKQQAFLEHGEERMQPLILRNIAEEVGMHESTVSRITTQKFMLTPQGLFELKHFFSSHLGTDSGAECSSTAIKALIKKFISEENPNKPLSDHRLSEMLMQKGIHVARRTVAKYREGMHIRPSNERKIIA